MPQAADEQPCQRTGSGLYVLTLAGDRICGASGRGGVAPTRVARSCRSRALCCGVTIHQATTTRRPTPRNPRESKPSVVAAVRNGWSGFPAPAGRGTCGARSADIPHRSTAAHLRRLTACSFHSEPTPLERSYRCSYSRKYCRTLSFLQFTAASSGNVETRPRVSTDPADLPAEKTGYAMRDLTRLIATATGHGSNVGIYAERLLDHDLPWTRMRQVYRLLGLVKRYGPTPVDTACGRALDLDVVAVTKIAAMLANATENAEAPPPRPASGLAPARFARDPREYRPAAPKLAKPDWMTVIDGGALNDDPQEGSW